MGFVLAIGVSVLVHAGVGELARVSGIAIDPAAVSCRVGELVHLEAVVRTPSGAAAGMASGVSWSLEFAGGHPLARSLGAGLFRCERVGTVVVIARADSGSARAVLAIARGVITLDLPPPAPPAQPPAPPLTSPVRARRIVKVRRPVASMPAVAPEPDDPEAAAPAPEAAAAAAIATAETARPPDSPAVTGAPGLTAGSGTVAVGGTAAAGAAGARAGGVPGGTGTAAVASLSRLPSLVDPDACQDFYPSAAEDDTGLVVVAVDVTAEGRAADVEVVREQPARQGFGEAVRRCFLAIRFAPARDTGGRVTAARVRLNFRFVR
jgi:TonB family protein